MLKDKHTIRHFSESFKLKVIAELSEGKYSKRELSRLYNIGYLMKTQRRQHKRIYYVPGILTLSIAPILFMAKTNKYIADRTEHCISVARQPETGWECELSLIPNIKYQPFSLTGVSHRDNKIILLIENYARGLQLSGIDTIGIKLILDNKIKYKTYVSIFNACLKSRIDGWIQQGDSVFIFKRTYLINFDMPDFYPICGTSLLQIKDKEPSLFQKILFQKDKILRYLPLEILFLLLAYSAIRKIKNEG